MVAKRCVVPNCPGNYSNLYKFPKDRKYEKRISKWLSATGNRELLHLPEKLLLERAICNIHFEAKYFFRRGLSRSAVPSLYLPEPIEVPLDHFSCVENKDDKNDGSNENRAINELSTIESTHITKDVQMHRNLKRFREENKGKAEADKHDGSNESRAINELSKIESTHITEDVQMHRNLKRFREENKGKAEADKNDGSNKSRAINEPSTSESTRITEGV